MMELGNESKKEHLEIISLVNRYQWKLVAMVGKYFNEINHTYKNFDTAEELKKWFTQQRIENASILIKGSRSIQMEKVIE